MLSTRDCFAALSSSGRGGDLSCTSGLSDVLVASSTVSDLAFGAADLGGGSRDSGAFQMGSFLSPTAAFGGLPLVIAAVFQSVHSMSVTASADQLLSSVSLLTVRVRKSPALLPTMCSSVCESLPNQQPYTNCVWLFCTCAPGLRARINTPNGKTVEHMF